MSELPYIEPIERLIGHTMFYSNMLEGYSDNLNVVALVHFEDSDITKLGMYNMLEHEVYPWTVDYTTLTDDYFDNLIFCITHWMKHKPTPDVMNLENVVIWVSFKNNPGFWYGKGDAKSGFITDGTSPYDDDENFILDSHPEYCAVPNWVFTFINQEMVYR